MPMFLQDMFYSLSIEGTTIPTQPDLHLLQFRSLRLRPKPRSLLALSHFSFLLTFLAKWSGASFS